MPGAGLDPDLSEWCADKKMAAASAAIFDWVKANPADQSGLCSS
jgi:hypothetical protein